MSESKVAGNLNENLTKQLTKPEKIRANLGDGFPRGHSRNIAVFSVINLPLMRFSCCSTLLLAFIARQTNSIKVLKSFQLKFESR